MFIQKLKEWYGKYLKEYRIIYDSEDTVIFVVRDINGNIDITRVFTIGEDYNVSVDYQGLTYKGDLEAITQFAI